MYDGLNANIKDSTFFECNLAINDVEQLNCKNIFWEDALKAWCQYNYEKPSEDEHVYKQIIWYNSHIKINHKLIYEKSWAQNGIMYVKDLYPYGELLSCN